MENPGCEDEHKVTGLVDYSSSSDDDDDDVSNEPSPSKRQHEDESPAPLPKKRRLYDLISDDNGSPKSDSEEKDKMNAVRKPYSYTHLYYSESDEDDTPYMDDTDVLNYGPYSWRSGDRYNGKEVYCVNLNGDIVESRIEESQCLELLSKIGCRERYLGCSIEMRTVFFANLNKHEAAKMKGLHEIREVVPYRCTVSTIW